MRRWFERLEEFAIDVIFARRAGKRATLLRWVLFAFSFAYRAAVQCRLQLFAARLLADHHPGVPVISVGNLTVGGTGKTPVVEMLARELHAGGRRVAILSRGYRSKKPPVLRRIVERFQKKPYAPRIVSNGRHVLLDSRMAGDEPYMLAVNLPGVVVLVDKNRVASARYAVEKMGCDALLLDDGMQFLHLRHRYDICLVDRGAPFGNGYLLPRGTLREPPENLRRATHIFITKSAPGADPALREQIARLNPVAEIVECAHKPLYLERLGSGERISADWLAGKYVGALCAIAVPESFEALLQKLGAKIEFSRHFADHHRFSEKEIGAVLDRCSRRSVDALLTTEKDSVRFPRIQRADVPIYFLRIQIEILEGHDRWNDLVDRICSPPSRRPVERVFA